MKARHELQTITTHNWTHAGLQCVLKIDEQGWFRGFVAVTVDHPWFDKPWEKVSNHMGGRGLDVSGPDKEVGGYMPNPLNRPVPGEVDCTSLRWWFGFFENRHRPHSPQNERKQRAKERCEALAKNLMDPRWSTYASTLTPLTLERSKS